MKKAIERPSVPRNETTTDAISSSGGDERLQQDGEDHEDHEQGERDDQLQVARRGLVEVGLHGAAVADQHARAVAAPRRARASRSTSTRSSAAASNGSSSKTSVEAGHAAVGRARVARVDRRHAVDVLRRLAHGRDVLVGHLAVEPLDQHGGRHERAGRERLLHDREAVGALRRLLEEVLDAVVLLVGEQPEGADAEQRERHAPAPRPGAGGRAGRRGATCPRAPRRRPRAGSRPRGGAARSRGGR